MAESFENWINDFDLSDRVAPEFYRNTEEISADANNAAQAHVMRRAWADMALDGILCVESVPTVYFKTAEQPPAEELRVLQRKLWSQGVAPILIVITPDKAMVYSGLATPAKSKERINESDRLVKIIDRVSEQQEIRGLVRTIESGLLFNQYKKSFDPENRVDRSLVKNLAAARDVMMSNPNRRMTDQEVHALLGRIVFTSYLTDRRIIQDRYFEEAGAVGCRSVLDIIQNWEWPESNRLLYALFKKLREDFNGDVFDGDLDKEELDISSSDVAALYGLLSGEDIETGQLTLGFWAYDFSVIPIETISAIYEGFLKVENPTDKRDSGTYYTPRFLAELVLDIALEGVDSLLGKRFLDPACGSGIFLVGLFNRLAEEWRRKNPTAKNPRRFKALLDIIRSSLYGIDKNETACRIAAFSLYLALLDQLKPRDIQELQIRGKILPKLVSYRGESNSADSPRNIFSRDFFEDSFLLNFERDPDLPREGFDLVLGNPPWTRAQQPRAKEWGRGLPIAQNQLAQYFVCKSGDHVNVGGKICFVLPAGILFNHQAKAIEFQKYWLKNFQIDKILNLADLRFFAFGSATAPFIVARFRPQERADPKHRIQYLTPKTEYKSLRVEVVSLPASETKSISQEAILKDISRTKSTGIWKKYYWGTPRDRRFIDRLLELPALNEIAGPPKEQKRWVTGEGFQPLGRNDSPDKAVPSGFRSGDFFLNANAKFHLVLDPKDCDRIGPRWRMVRRMPGKARAIFAAPHVLIAAGSLKAAYSNFDVYFRHAINSIHGPRVDENILRFVAAFIASDLAKYFLFHTSSGWGIERDEIDISEILRLPFPLPAENYGETHSLKLMTEVSRLMQGIEEFRANSILFEPSSIEELYESRILPLIYDYFRVTPDEKMLIDTTLNVAIPSITPNRNGRKRIPVLEESSSEERTDYLRVLCSTINGWATSGEFGVSGRTIVSYSTGEGIAIVSKSPNRRAGLEPIEEISRTSLDDAISRMWTIVHSKTATISHLAEIKVFDRDSIYILKPLAKWNWTTTCALNDADEIAASILRRNG